MVLCGCDPSFKRAGLAIYDSEQNELVITCCKTEVSSQKSFQQIFSDVEGQTDRIVNEMLLRKVEQVLSECPPPQGQFAPGLYALDTVLFHRLMIRGVSIRVVYPNYLGHVHGKKGYKKSESVVLAKSILERLEKHMDVTILSKRLSNDESEALIFLCRLFVINHMFEDDLKDIKGLFSSKEKELEVSADGK